MDRGAADVELLAISERPMPSFSIAPSGGGIVRIKASVDLATLAPLDPPEDHRSCTGQALWARGEVDRWQIPFRRRLTAPRPLTAWNKLPNASTSAGGRF